MVSAIIVAAGKGLRMKRSTPKQYLMLAGRPILWHTLQRIEGCQAVDRIVVVVPPADQEFCRERIILPLNCRKSVTLIGGGDRRQLSVFKGLEALACGCDLVLIHDGVRPFVTCELICACAQTAASKGACIAAVPSNDTVKQVAAGATIGKTLDRKAIWLAQTPQAFRYDLIYQAHQAARRQGLVGSDDAVLVERMGHPVHVVPGSRNNIKITTAEDLLIAEAIYRFQNDQCGQTR